MRSKPGWAQPLQWRDITCGQCKLCEHSRKAPAIIGFIVHGFAEKWGCITRNARHEKQGLLQLP